MEKKDKEDREQNSQLLSQTNTTNIHNEIQIQKNVSLQITHSNSPQTNLQQLIQKKNLQQIVQPLTSVSQIQQKVANLSQVSLTDKQLELKTELQNMQFEPELIMKALKQTQNLEQAIEFIIEQIESLEKNSALQGLSNDVKLFFIVRMDLKMGTGKIAAQVGHAALKAFQQMRYSSSTNDKNASLLIQWMENGQKNKILQVETQYELRDYLQKASEKYINKCYIRDAGRTQIAAGSTTVGAIGPVRESDVIFLKDLKQL